MTLLVMLLTTAMAWADETVTAKYIDTDGIEKSIDIEHCTELTGGEDITLSAGNYVVKQNILYTGKVKIIGDIKIVLKDGCTMSVGTESAPINDNAIEASSNNSIDIYATSTGSSAGTLQTYANCEDGAGIYTNSGNVTIFSGKVNTYVTGSEGAGIYTDSGIVTINGGIFNVSVNGWYGYGIFAYSGSVIINGGEINAENSENGIYAYMNNITITGGTVTATGDDFGISTGGEIIINGGTIEATGNDFGIRSENEKITITGGTVTATGGIFTNSSSDITITGGKVTADGKEDGISCYGDIIISGGDITAISTSNNNENDRGGIWTYGGNIIITDGNVIATATGTTGNGLFSGQDEYDGGTITISGGTVIANGNKSGIYAKTVEGNFNTITLSGGSVFAKASDENLANTYRGNVIIANDLIYSDGTNTYEGLQTLDNDEKTAIAGKGMHPIQESYPLTANLANGDYWTTFYSNDDKYALSGDNASAYIATYDTGDEITLKELGKVIPKGTAVVIVASGNGTDASIDLTLTKSTDDVEFPQVVSGNKLRGVDVRTDKSTLGSGTFYVLGKTIVSGVEHFGFHPYNGAYMPARKAYLLIGSSARSISMVFKETARIKSIDKGQIGNVSDAWYSLDGKKLMEMPTTKGLYINNGKKVVIK